MTCKSQYGWMALGGLLCLFGLVVASKVRDGNKALASGDPPAVVPEKPAAAPPSTDVPRLLPPISTEPIIPVPASMPEPVPAPVSEPVLPPVSEVVPTAATVPVTTVETPPASVQGAPAAPTLAMPPPLAVVPQTPPAIGSDARPIVIPASATVSPIPPATQVPPTPMDDGRPLPPIKPPVEAKPTPPPAPPAPPAPVTPPAPQVEPIKSETVKDHRDEPPLAPTPGPVVQYKVPRAGETFKSLARKMLGAAERWTDIHKLNPTLRTDGSISAGTIVRLPGDACIEDGHDHELVRPLPTLRTRVVTRPRAAMPLTGTFPIALDDHKVMTLPRRILDQLGNCDMVLLSPGSDRCLWLTNQAHLDRLQTKLDKSPAREADVRGFKRLYYAQTVKVPIRDGRLAISEKLVLFAGLGAELVLVGIDDHFEIWDAARWRKYTQTKKAAGSTED